ncbi:uncharacterized protein LOC136091448 [Hydra vulgaris]|uniref:Uncharacterized protein LOC136091448 n=1 Tax=Hydra vulgaris TaxID=6087 RepID=A0ABM4DKR2_HYDVU
MPKEYVVSLDILLTSSFSYWTNIVHFTIEGNYLNYGDRTPGLFFHNNILQICSPVNGIAPYCVYSKPLELDTWTTAKISQLIYEGYYNYTVQINNETINTCINNYALDFRHVKLYASNPWIQATPGYIRNLVVRNACSENDVYCKPFIKVLFNGELTKSKLNLTTQINYIYEPGEFAVNVTWQYFLPKYLNFEYDLLSYNYKKVSFGNFKYMILQDLASYGAKHTIVTTFLNTSCSSGIYNIEIPLKLSFQNSYGNSWSLYQTVKKSIFENCKGFISPQKHIQSNYQTEYYGRGIYWNDAKSHLYLCINQYVPSTKRACFFTEDNGMHWSGLDLRIGCILGHHTLTKELYAIHKNQKTYLMFHNTYKKWLAITDDNFKTKISSNLNWNLLKLFEKDNDQAVTFGTNQWMCNGEGLHFRNSSNNYWIQRVKWKDCGINL